MIRLCSDEDIEQMYQIINDAASAYRGIIPDDRYHEPYMEGCLRNTGTFRKGRLRHLLC